MSNQKPLLDYLKKLPVDQFARDQFAKKCGTSWAYLKQVAYGNKACQAWLAVNIERESCSQVRCEEICTEQIDWAFLRSSIADAPSALHENPNHSISDAELDRENSPGEILVAQKTNRSHTSEEQVRETESSGCRAAANASAA